jgi:hypothetical protein
MKNCLFSFFACAFVLLFANNFSVNGQDPLPATPDGSSLGGKFYEMRNRASELARIKKELSKPEEKKEEASFPKIKKDFEKLQIINTERLQKNSVGNNLNYKIIADAAEEINKRAAKLKAALFPSGETEKKAAVSPKNLSAGDFQKIIIALDNAIYHFVSSPIFQNTKLVKPEDSQYAQKELNKIILLSGILESSAEKMK